MKKSEILGWFVDICLGWLMIVVIVLLSKLAFDVISAPNIFKKEEPALEQKKIDEMCVAWWFESDLGSAKKRVCGK
jgi:hypothetical protein